MLRVSATDRVICSKKVKIAAEYYDHYIRLRDSVTIYGNHKESLYINVYTVRRIL
uniref:Uncharacterized protein n=1 Tax=Virgibacillus oceani TaxID=1479511 RepID=A0A917GXY0_9BACI|nr:hypothetical protein GCM10011398_00440 [Virgibacillus oceani]